MSKFLFNSMSDIFLDLETYCHGCPHLTLDGGCEDPSDNDEDCQMLMKNREYIKQVRHCRDIVDSLGDKTNESFRIE